MLQTCVNKILKNNFKKNTWTKKTFFKILLTQVCSAYCGIKLLFKTFFSVCCTLKVIREKVEVPIWLWGYFSPPYRAIGPKWNTPLFLFGATLKTHKVAFQSVSPGSRCSLVRETLTGFDEFLSMCTTYLNLQPGFLNFHYRLRKKLKNDLYYFFFAIPTNCNLFSKWRNTPLSKLILLAPQKKKTHVVWTNSKNITRF